jgi:hypothetical protein
MKLSFCGDSERLVKANQIIGLLEDRMIFISSILLLNFLVNKFISTHT